MIHYTRRLDTALRRAGWSHEQAGQHRKGGNIPYIIHPVAVMMCASNVTDDEDTLIACLLHDILEDVDHSIYSEEDMRQEFGNRVVGIVRDVTKNSQLPGWQTQAAAYLEHLEHDACAEAITVSASDKIHNLFSTLMDYDDVGEEVWQRFTTKSGQDQLWWYESVLGVMRKRGAPEELIAEFAPLVDALRQIVRNNAIMKV